jgi:hypothetical protein
VHTWQTATLETEFCGQRLPAPRAVNEPRRRWNGHGRPTISAASPGNVVLFYGLGNYVGLRGLLGGAEGIRTSDLRGAGTRALHCAAVSGSAGLLSKARRWIPPAFGFARLNTSKAARRFVRSLSRLPCSARHQEVERLAGFDENRGMACGGLAAARDHLDIRRVELDAAADATSLVGGDEGRARSEKRVNDDIAPIGEL